MDLGSNDPGAPTLQDFKILMGDSIRTEIIHGYPASVKFTAADLTHYPDYVRKYHSLAQARFYLKDTVDMGWVEIPVTPMTNLLDSLFGMPYMVDIAQPLSEFADSTLIDFKVELIDSAGNSTVQIMHPACMVRDVHVGEEPLPASSRISIFPNPVQDILTILGCESFMTMEIFSVTGCRIMEVTGANTIDVSDIKPGVYLLYLTSHPSEKVSCYKFVKVDQTNHP